MTNRQAQIQTSFETFQKEIDGYNDRRGRLIKISRDVTVASKRLIFGLHRFPHQSLLTSSKLDDSSRELGSKAAEKVLIEAHLKRDEIVSIIIQAAKREGLDKEFQESGDAESDSDLEIGRATRYERAIGSGLEEFIEAISFLHFLEHTLLISLEQVQAFFIEDGKIIFPIPISRYLLGLSDLTGELMRFATNAVGSGGASDIVLIVLNLIRDLRSNLEPFVPHIRDMKKKQVVTTQSMVKIEDISYAIKVRSSEFGSNPAALQEMLRRSLNSDNRREGDSHMEKDD